MTRKPVSQQPLTASERFALMRSATATLADRPSLDASPAIAATDSDQRRRDLAGATAFERMRHVSGVPEIHRNPFGRCFVATIRTPDADDASLSIVRWLNHARRLLFTIESEIAGETETEVLMQSIYEDQQAIDAAMDLVEVGQSLGLSIEFVDITPSTYHLTDPLAEIEAMLRDDDQSEHE